MSSTEQLLDQHLRCTVPGGVPFCTCGWAGENHAAHVVAVLAEADHVIVKVPSVEHKGPYDTDASFFRQVAENLDRDLYAGGSNVRRAVSTLLRNVAGALTDDPRTTREIRTEAARNVEGYYLAARDSKGNIRLRNGQGLMVANANHTRDDVQGWFDRSQPGQYREQYRAALALLDREAGTA